MSGLVTHGLVIRRADYSDYDRMITLFTPEHGRIDAIVRGCKRPKSPLMNAAEPFCAGEYQLHRTKDRYSVSQCQITDSFYEIRQDYDKLMHGVYWLNLLEAAAMPDMPAPTLFMVALRALAFLNYSDLPPQMLTMAFEMHYMAQQGMRPMMHQCVNCGRPVEGDARFDMERGGAVCPACQSDAPFISHGARRILMKLPGTKFDQVRLLEGNENWVEAARIFRKYIRLKVDRYGKMEPELP
jgi:DNA repair protein RecO (recombination protein O)